MTRYIVLQQAEPNLGDWQVLGENEATNARQAIRLALDSSSDVQPTGLFVAVPARSWAPVKVNVETQMKLKFT